MRKIIMGIVARELMRGAKNFVESDKVRDLAIKVGTTSRDTVVGVYAKTREFIDSRPPIYMPTPMREVQLGDRIQRVNHPNQRGELASVKDGWALIWWDDEILMDSPPPVMLPYCDLEHEQVRIF